MQQSPCDECRVLFDVDTLTECDAFGVRLVCEDCEQKLYDEAEYEAHGEEELRCDCPACLRHLARLSRERAEDQLALNLARARDDIGF